MELILWVGCVQIGAVLVAYGLYCCREHGDIVRLHRPIS